MRINTNAGGHEALAVVLPDVAGALRHSVSEIRDFFLPDKAT